jgi:hypothetical protein
MKIFAHKDDIHGTIKFMRNICVTGARDGLIKIYNLMKKKCIKSIKEHTYLVWAIC